MTDGARLVHSARERAYIPTERSTCPLRDIHAKSSWDECRAVERDSEKVSGAWVFANTRVPVRALFENLEDGATVDHFVEWFPGVTREQVEAVLEVGL